MSRPLRCRRFCGRIHAWSASTSTGCGSPTPVRASARCSSCCTVRHATAACGSGCSPTSHVTTPSSLGARRVSGNRRTSTTAGKRPIRRRPRGLHCLARSRAAARCGAFVRDDGRPLAVRAPPRDTSESRARSRYAGRAGSLPPDEVARRLEMFIGMAELGDAFDAKSYPGLFSDLIPPTAMPCWRR
jgi:hypothetical protein